MALRRTLAPIAALLGCLVLFVAPATAGAAPRATVAAPAVAATPLTNLAHLDFLGATVVPPAQAGHGTYRLAAEPAIGVLWTYANRQDDGSYLRVGGGDYDAATNTWGQGAFNSDDISRAAVVYLRHWKATGSTTSMRTAYELLRGLTYLQTISGKNAGNVVLWMQPDGTLHASVPGDLPDPSDSDASYWLARTTWALGEGYAAFADVNPGFATFLKDRLDLAIRALDRQVLVRYGSYLHIDGRQVPAWLVVNGADATAEAVLGLSAYVRAGGPDTARLALARFAEGIAAMSAGDARDWPFGAVLPWGLSRSDWHAWASQMPAALARASVALGDPALARVAAKDSAVFDPWLLTSGGPDNGRLPTALDGTQIAYGIDSRVQSLVATYDATHRSGLLQLAGITAAWYFGANTAGARAYDPSTGRPVDGISATGDVNLNAGAESTIHALLSMLILDQHADLAAIARTATIRSRVGTTTVQAEDAVLAGGATVVVLAPDHLWTGESLYGGVGYAAVGNGASATFTVEPAPARLVLPVVNLRPSSTAVTTFAAGAATLGSVRSGAVGAQGDSPALGALLPVTLPRILPAGTTTFTATTVSSAPDDTATIDAVMLEPLLSRYVLGGGGHGTALLRNVDSNVRDTTVTLPGTGTATIESYDGRGRLRATATATAQVVPAMVLPGGFTIARR